MDTTARFLALAAMVAMLSPASTSLPADPPPKEKSICLIFLVDYSGSIADFNPPDTMQALLLHAINLAELAQQPVTIAVVFFGGNGVRVVGDPQGMPTAAYATLRQELLANWPKPNGATPMDEAFAAALKIVRKLPRDCSATVMLLSDGQPESCRLRPEDFPAIAAEMTHCREAITKKYQGFPPEILQHYLRQLEQEWATPGTEEFNRLYRVQLAAEFERTLEHAAALAKGKVRFVTVDFAAGIPELAKIHQAAAGTPGDLVLTSPNAVIGKLHGLGLTALPRVVLPPPRSYDAQPGSFQRTIEVPLDAIASAGMVTIEFQPAIPAFAANVVLKASVEGKQLTFSPQNDDLQCQLAVDGKGNVATATLMLETIPKDGRVSFQFESPRGSLHVPACTVYTYLRLPEGTEADFRPAFSPPETAPPYTVSPNHHAVWTCALRTKGDPKPHPLRSAEAVLRHARSGAITRLELKPDERSPGVFATEETAVPAGSYHVELHLVLPSGAKFSLILTEHIESILRDESLALEVFDSTVQGTTGTMLGQLNFGPLGDAVTRKSLSVIVRTLKMDYPITVIPSFTLADCQGTVPEQAWITFDKPQLLLQPGRAEKLRVTLTLPKRIEEAIEDGRFEGRLSLLRADLKQPMSVTRYAKIAGVDDTEPLERITFALTRPTMTIAAPYAFRNRIKTMPDGKIELPIHVSIGQPFARRVTIEVTHDSALAREVKLLPSAIFTDPEGREVPSVRLSPVESTTLAQPIAPGGSARWEFQFAIDADCPAQRACGTLDLSAPGMAVRHMSLVVETRKPLLAATIRTACWALLAVCAVLALAAAGRRFRLRALRTGAEHLLTPRRPLKGVLSVTATPQGRMQLVAEEPMRVGSATDGKTKLVAAGRPLLVEPSEVGPSRPLVLEIRHSDGGPSCTLEATDCPTAADGSPELYLKVSDAEHVDRQRGLQARRAGKLVSAAAACGLLAATLNYPVVLTAVQWVYDFFTL